MVFVYKKAKIILALGRGEEVLTNMPEAPSANALKTSVPRRTPPSKKTGRRPSAALTT